MDPHYEHQIKARELLWKFGVFALIMEQGTGKSRPVLDDWMDRSAWDGEKDLVILAPKGCYMNWIGSPEEPGEIDKWIPADVRSQIHIGAWRAGANQSQRTALIDLLHARGPRFLTMNIEALNRDGNAREYLMKFVNGRKVIGTIDESTTICHEEAARTKFILYELSTMFYARRILSGLVAPESPQDLFTQYWFLDWHIINQRTIWGFRNRYAIIKKMDFRSGAERALAEAFPDRAKKYKTPQVIVGYRNTEELTAKIMKFSYRVLKKDVLDLPPKIYQSWDVEMTLEQTRIYDEMRDIAMARLMNGEYSTASMKLDQLGKLQHILCGHVRAESGEVVEDIPELRTDALVEILHQTSDKAIIWAPYPRTLRKIVARLREEFGPDSTVGFWGEHDLDERLEARARIQRDETCRFIVSNQSVGKFGNTWTACNLVVYYANSFDNEDRQQSEDRPHRIGQTKSVTYIDLWCRGTINDRQIQVLRNKITISSAIQGDEFKKWLI